MSCQPGTPFGTGWWGFCYDVLRDLFYCPICGQTSHRTADGFYRHRP